MPANRKDYNYNTLRETFGSPIADEFRRLYGAKPKMRVWMTHRQAAALIASTNENERNALIAQIVHWNNNH